MKNRIEYRTQIASDVVRDGLGLELLDQKGNVIAEVFRSDTHHRIILNTFNNDIPIELIQKLVEEAKVALNPYEDGTPIDGTASK
jgi:hypothetical protein